VFRILRIGFVVACLGALFWFGTQVQLGELTLYEHVRAIGQSKESQGLIDGTKERLSGVWGNDDEKPGKATPAKATSARPTPGEIASGKPADAVPEADRKALKKLIESRR
jgi:hypothetical protein